MEHETFFSLLRNPAHWEFELFLIFVFDVVVGMLIWPCLKRMNKHHKSDDKKIEDLQKQVKQIQNIMGIK